MGLTKPPGTYHWPMDVAAVLSQRISDLDQPRENRMAWAAVSDYIDRIGREPGNVATSLSPLADLAYVVDAIDEVAGTLQPDDGERHRLISAAEADVLMRSCQILRRLADSAPEITQPPVRLDSQYWVATGRPEFLPDPDRTPSRSSFIDVAWADPTVHATKPAKAGLFTSTGVLGTHGMWRVYLDMNQGSSLFPEPWYTWRMKVRNDVTVREITSAADWVELVESYPATDGERLYLDWKRIAGDYDGVHLTLPAVVTIEGIPFATRNGITAPVFWGVESTLWLRWRFTEQSLCEKSLREKSR